MNKLFIVLCLAFITKASLSLAATYPFTETTISNSENDSLRKPTSELKIKLSENGNYYLKATLLNQAWLRASELNAGSLVNNEPTNHLFDIGLRRTRIQLYGMVAPHTFLYFQFGQNNFNFLASNSGNRKLQAFFHDAVAEFIPNEQNNALKIGAGLTIVNGLSRFSQPSVGTIATLDVPVFAQATVDQTDEFSRKLSVYARGQLGKFDYRVSISDPFPIYTNGSSTLATIPFGNNSSFTGKGHHLQQQAYVQYNLFEMEPHTLPYMAGTYLGTKRIWNVAAGLIHQNKAMWHKEGASDTVYSPMNLWALESFLDIPINKESGTAINAYIGYFHYGFGPNYLRYNGIMNNANGISGMPNTTAYGVPSAGVAYPMFGTGNAFYGQLAYLLPKGTLPDNWGKLMPYASGFYGNWERLSSPTTVVDIGCNWLVDGHRSKISFDFQSRPTYQFPVSYTHLTLPTNREV